MLIKNKNLSFSATREANELDDFSSYDGAWKHGKRHGFGTMEYKRQRVYTGDWVENKRQGKGKMIYS